MVLDHIETQKVDRIICLGDILGYGPNPVECVDLIAERCEWSLMGNHDFGVLYEPTNFNSRRAGRVLDARAVREGARPGQGRQALGVPRQPAACASPFGDFLCVHGSPRRPINEYLFPEDAINSPVKMQQIFERIEKYCLVGHTHVPGVFTNEPDFYPPDDLDGVYKFERTARRRSSIPARSASRATLDPRSSYAILDDAAGDARGAAGVAVGGPAGGTAGGRSSSSACPTTSRLS